MQGMKDGDSESLQDLKEKARQENRQQKATGVFTLPTLTKNDLYRRAKLNRN